MKIYEEWDKSTYIKLNTNNFFKSVDKINLVDKYTKHSMDSCYLVFRRYQRWRRSEQHSIRLTKDEIGGLGNKLGRWTSIGLCSSCTSRNYFRDTRETRIGIWNKRETRVGIWNSREKRIRFGNQGEERIGIRNKREKRIRIRNSRTPQLGKLSRIGSTPTRSCPTPVWRKRDRNSTTCPWPGSTTEIDLESEVVNLGYLWSSYLTDSTSESKRIGSIWARKSRNRVQEIGFHFHICLFIYKVRFVAH